MLKKHFCWGSPLLALGLVVIPGLNAASADPFAHGWGTFVSPGYPMPLRPVNPPVFVNQLAATEVSTPAPQNDGNPPAFNLPFGTRATCSTYYPDGSYYDEITGFTPATTCGSCAAAAPTTSATSSEVYIGDGGCPAQWDAYEQVTECGGSCA